MVVYLILMNALALGFMYADKQFAEKHLWRIPERFLLLTALLGGSIGIWFGMGLFRHKTKHTRFVLGIPAILSMQLSLILFVK